MPAARSFFSSASVSSSLALAMISPVSASTMLRASMRPTRKSSGTLMNCVPVCSSVRTWRAVMRLSFSTTTLPSLSVMSKRATSPRRRSATNSICAPESIRRKLSKTKKCARIASGFRPMALSRIVTGILRRRSTRKYRMSFGSNSKSSHEPRYGMMRALNSSLPLECVLPLSCSKNTPGERCSCETITRSVPLTMNEP